MQCKFNFVVVRHMSNIFLNASLVLEFKYPRVSHTKNSVVHSNKHFYRYFYHIISKFNEEKFETKLRETNCHYSYKKYKSFNLYVLSGRELESLTK